MVKADLIKCKHVSKSNNADDTFVKASPMVLV